MKEPVLYDLPLSAATAAGSRGSHPSTHAWGIAIDLEAERYPLGSAARMPDDVVAVFHKAGFFYGGDFLARKDPMHFQFCTRY